MKKILINYAQSKYDKSIEKHVYSILNGVIDIHSLSFKVKNEANSNIIVLPAKGERVFTLGISINEFLERMTGTNLDCEKIKTVFMAIDRKIRNEVNTVLNNHNVEYNDLRHGLFHIIENIPYRQEIFIDTLNFTFYLDNKTKYTNKTIHLMEEVENVFNRITRAF